MKKLIVLIFLPFILKAMEPQSQLTLADAAPAIQSAYISSAQMPAFYLPMDAAQRELIKKILTYETYSISRTTVASVVLSGGTTLMGSTIGIIGFAALLAGKCWNRELCLKGGIMGTSIALFSTAILCAAVIVEACRRAQAKKTYNQYLQEGQHIALESFEKDLSEIIKNGFSGQPLCCKNCLKCMSMRKKCDKCCPANQKNDFAQNCEQKMCTTCWNDICKNCEVCLSMRYNEIIKHIQEYLKNELDLNGDSDQIDVGKLQNYLNNLTQKQNDRSHDAAVSLESLSVQQ